MSEVTILRKALQLSCMHFALHIAGGIDERSTPQYWIDLAEQELNEYSINKEVEELNQIAHDFFAKHRGEADV
jgi:hypothetical protein